MKHIGNLIRHVATAVRRADPRVKMLVLVSLSAAAVVAGDRPRLTVPFAMALAWAAMAAVSARHARPGRLIWLVCALAFVGLAIWMVDVRAERFVAPLVRVATLLTAGWAFSASTSSGELAWALGRLHCPKTVVLAAMITWNLAGLVVSEARLAREGARVRARCAPKATGFASRLRAWWRLAAAFCARLFLRADQLAAGAEARGVSHPGRRSALRAGRLRPLSVVLGGACAALPLVAALV